jgi:hypothetical protein
MMCERRLREIRLDTHPNAAALSTQLWRISMPVHYLWNVDNRWRMSLTVGFASIPATQSSRDDAEVRERTGCVGVSFTLPRPMIVPSGSSAHSPSQ